MLDDLAYIHRLDKADALGIAAKEPDQLTHDFRLDLSMLTGAKNVIYAGMGGSALAAGLSVTWPGYRVPFEIVRGYSLPHYVDENSLCFVSSASGNTEETLSALSDAEEKGAKIVIIAGGGKLDAISQEKKYPGVLLPKVRQPRYGVFYNYKALVDMLMQTGVSSDDDSSLLYSASNFLKEKLKRWEPTVPTKDNLAKQIALDTLGKSVVIYAGPELAPAAYKWKISFNENAKQVAWCGYYPEFNHNEFIGWSEQPVDKPYCVIDLRSNLEHKRVQKRFELSERLLSGRRPSPIVVQAEGNSLVEQLLYCVQLGDFVSLYAALAAGNDPEPVELVEKFKRLMAE